VTTAWGGCAGSVGQQSAAGGFRRSTVLAWPRPSCLTGKLLLAYGGSVGDVFKALADPTRRTILDELAERERQTLFELCSRLATKHQITPTRQAISQHLEVLEGAGLVRSRREGRYKFHDLQTTPLETLTDRWLKRERTEDP
jgi:DNA-binding transcriptional ArsR family regulator